VLVLIVIVQDEGVVWVYGRGDGLVEG
jgi:hypothetical protein